MKNKNMILWAVIAVIIIISLQSYSQQQSLYLNSDYLYPKRTSTTLAFSSYQDTQGAPVFLKVAISPSYSFVCTEYQELLDGWRYGPSCRSWCPNTGRGQCMARMEDSYAMQYHSNYKCCKETPNYVNNPVINIGSKSMVIIGEDVRGTYVSEDLKEYLNNLCGRWTPQERETRTSSRYYTSRSSCNEYLAKETRDCSSLCFRKDINSNWQYDCTITTKEAVKDCGVTVNVPTTGSYRLSLVGCEDPLTNCPTEEEVVVARTTQIGLLTNQTLVSPGETIPLKPAMVSFDDELTGDATIILTITAIDEEDSYIQEYNILIPGAEQ